MFHSLFEKMQAASYFWPKTKKKGACLFWKGGVDPKTGYGKFVWEGKTYYSHRFSYLLCVGEIPKDILVCHCCDNRPCVEPTHLWLGSHKENSNDMISKNRHNKKPNVIGTAHPLSKLDEEKIQIIRKDKRPCAIIAIDFSVSPTLIWNIKKYKTWKHIT